MSETTLWAVSRHHDYEGHGPPRAVFLTEAEAKAYAAHVSEQSTEHAVTAVALMRFIPAKIEPVALPAPAALSPLPLTEDQT